MKHPRASLLLALALALTASACRSSRTAQRENSGQSPEKIMAANGPVDSVLARMDPQFYINRAEGNDGYLLGFSVGGGGASGSPEMAALRGITRFTAHIYTADDAELAQVTTDDIERSGTASGDGASTTAYARTEWKTEKSAAYALMTIETDKGSVTRHVWFPGVGGSTARSATSPAVEMTLEGEPRGSSMEFILKVRRTAPAPDGEYRPSGEQYRIEIQDDGGETIWSSSRGLMFTQMVGEVEPVEVGKEITYRAIWSGLDYRTHERAAPGRYRIIATLPAKPTPYILREELTWSGR